MVTYPVSDQRGIRTHIDGLLARECSHRVPGGQDYGVGVERLLQLRRQMTLWRGDLVHVLVEPGVVHLVETLVSDRVAVAILHPPVSWFPVYKVQTGKEHGVGHLALAQLESRRFIQGKLRLIYAGVVEELGVPQAEVPV